MIVLISSAKTMASVSTVQAPKATRPRFLHEANEIALNMTQYSTEELGRMLKINPRLAAENYMRFRHFHSDNIQPLQAILAYTGVVYKNIHPRDFSPEDFQFAQDQLRIASFGYGLLRPLDGIKTYRMEADVKIPELAEGNISNYWRDKITSTFLNDIQQSGNILINLASMDIQTAFHWKEIEKKTTLITPDFKMWKSGKLKTIVIYAKMARGQMTRHIIKNRITNPGELKAFTWEGFAYNEELSTGNNWVFIQN